MNLLAHQALIMTAGSVGGMLDAHTSGLACALSIRKRLTAYSGSAFRVRESSGNTEADIGFSGTALDTAALAAHVGSASGYIRTCYDQSGAGQNFGNATQANQPRVVNAGTFDGKLVFDGSNDGFVSANSSGSIAGLTIYARANLRSKAALAILFEMSTDFGANNHAAGTYYDPGSSGQVATIRRAAGGGGALSRKTSTNVAPDGTVWAQVFDPANAANSNGLRFYDEGSLIANTSISVNTSTANIGSFLYYLGARNSGAAFPSPLDLTDFLIYNVAHSGTTVGEISAILAIQ